MRLLTEKGNYGQKELGPAGKNPKIASAERTGHILQNFVRLKEMDSAAEGN